jgi:hypothetical protein
MASFQQTRRDVIARIAKGAGDDVKFLIWHGSVSRPSCDSRRDEPDYGEIFCACRFSPVGRTITRVEQIIGSHVGHQPGERPSLNRSPRQS